MDDLLILPVLVIIWVLQWLADKRLKKKAQAKKSKSGRTIPESRPGISRMAPASSPAPKDDKAKDPLAQFFKTIQAELAPESQIEDFFENEEWTNELDIRGQEKNEREIELSVSKSERSADTVQPQPVISFDHYAIAPQRTARQGLHFHDDPLLNSVIFSILLSPPKAYRRSHAGPVKPI